MGHLYDEAARAQGVRWISVDKPGYGQSSYDPHRSLARYSDDVRFLMDHLGLERAAVVGESGGGPHVYALAHALPERVTVAISVSGLGPADEAWAREGMTAVNRYMLTAAVKAPWLLRGSMALMSRTVFARQRLLTAMLSVQMPPCDRAVMHAHPELMDAIFAGSAGGFQQGSRAAAQEFAMFARPWHFSLEDIQVPVEIWHGTEDVNVPVAIAHEASRRVPRCRAHIVEGAGHLAYYDHRDEIVQTVLNAALT